MAETIAPLTQDERAVLMIAAQGQSMIPIGKWASPIKNLVLRGLMRSLDTSNVVITAAGKTAIDAYEADVDRDLVRVVNDVAAVQEPIRELAEQSAQILAKIAKASSVVTGDTPWTAAGKWSETILSRAVEIMGDK